MSSDVAATCCNISKAWEEMTKFIQPFTKIAEAFQVRRD